MKDDWLLTYAGLVERLRSCTAVVFDPEDWTLRFSVEPLDTTREAANAIEYLVSVIERLRREQQG